MHVHFPNEICCHPVLLHSSYKKLFSDLFLNYMWILLFESWSRRKLFFHKKWCRYSFRNFPLLIDKLNPLVLLWSKLRLQMIDLSWLFVSYLRRLLATHSHTVHYVRLLHHTAHDIRLLDHTVHNIRLLEDTLGFTVYLILFWQLSSVKALGLLRFP